MEDKLNNQINGMIKETEELRKQIIAELMLDDDEDEEVLDHNLLETVSINDEEKTDNRSSIPDN